MHGERTDGRTDGRTEEGSDKRIGEMSGWRDVWFGRTDGWDNNTCGSVRSLMNPPHMIGMAFAVSYVVFSGMC